MVNFLTGCLRKGFVIGRMSQAINRLHVNHDVYDEPYLEVSRDSVKELKDLIRPLKKNFRSSQEEVRLIEASLKNVSKLLRGKPKKEALDTTRKELSEIRTNLRKVIQKGFSECGTKVDTYASYQINDLTNDRAHYYDTNPEAKARMDRLRENPRED